MPWAYDPPLLPALRPTHKSFTRLVDQPMTPPSDLLQGTRSMILYQNLVVIEQYGDASGPEALEVLG